MIKDDEKEIRQLLTEKKGYILIPNKKVEIHIPKNLSKEEFMG